uniref:Uncharacterized protein n=1 Tax=Hemiselmis andersenii TaxID=464988 RepID=A0A7S1MZ60_HEMAN
MKSSLVMLSRVLIVSALLAASASAVPLRRQGDVSMSSMPTGCECIGKAAIQDALGEDNVKKFGEDYGSFCAAFEDGKCTNSNPMGMGQHACGTAEHCATMWPTYDFNTNQAWCCDSWCYVNRTTCTDAKAEEYGITVAKSWTEKEIWYSYDVCPDSYSKPTKFEYTPAKNYEQYNMSQCPYVVTAPGCECTGNNDALGAEEKAKHGTNYGKWCAAWEDGMCNSSATKGPMHTCEGSIAQNCSTHWPTTDFNVSQNWCCDAWCYV